MTMKASSVPPHILTMKAKPWDMHTLQSYLCSKQTNVARCLCCQNKWHMAIQHISDMRLSYLFSTWIHIVSFRVGEQHGVT